MDARLVIIVNKLVWYSCRSAIRVLGQTY